MPWTDIKLSDGVAVGFTGSPIPTIAFGTGRLKPADRSLIVDWVAQAIEAGFTHIDTAQIYGNELETGQGIAKAIKSNFITSDSLYVTTKYWGTDGKSIAESMGESLQKLGLPHVDLYLIHAPVVALPDIPTAWKEMEKLHDAGLAKNIGVSNFTPADLALLLSTARIKPAANQIAFYPGILARQLPTIQFGAQHGIVTEGYSALEPLARTDKLTSAQSQAVLAAITPIAARLGASNEQVLLAWAKAKGVVVVTSSRDKERVKGFLAAGDVELTAEDIQAIDATDSVKD